MMYQTLNLTNYTIWAIIFFGLTMVFGFSIVIIDKSTGQHNEKDTTTKAGKATMTLIALTGLFAIATIIPMAMNVQANNENNKIATQNIMKKYDVEDVLWKDKATEVYSNGSKERDGSGELLVQLNTGEKQVYLYEVNPETSEPTLKDSPLRGTTPADSLLKN